MIDFVHIFLLDVICNETGVKVQASEAIPYKFNVLNYPEIASSQRVLNESGTRNDKCFFNI